MNESARDSALAAETFLESLIYLAQHETAEYLERDDIPGLLWHFSKLRDAFHRIEEKFDALKDEVESISTRDIPTLFGNHRVRTINIEGIGRCTINTRWFASMRKGLKPSCLDWLRANKADGLIIETVAAPTLTAFAKQSALDGSPLPDDLFDVGTKLNTSITKV